MSDPLILSRSQVPGTNVFLVGCFDKRVTVYSQQVRALNLVDALVDQGRTRVWRSVAVVGGGAAGLTAAVALSIAVPQADVHIYEREHYWLHLQRNSPRYLHPYIYDWPAAISEPPRIRLPLLHWSPGPASEVRDAIVESFQQHQAANPRIRPHLDAKVSGLAQTAEGSWTLGGVGDNWHDAVILAIGFGYEKNSEDNRSYWYPSPVGDDIRDAKDVRTILISGNGDGGLAELIAAAYSQSHQEMCDFVTMRYDLENVREQLIAIEGEAWRSESFDIYEAYCGRLDPPEAFLTELRNLLRTDVSVDFYAKSRSGVFTRYSSVLNRFLAYLAIRADERDESAGEPRRSPHWFRNATRCFGLRAHVVRHDVTRQGKIVRIGRRTLKRDYTVLRHGVELDANLKPFQPWVETLRPRSDTLMAPPETPVLFASARARFAGRGPDPSPPEGLSPLAGHELLDVGEKLLKRIFHTVSVERTNLLRCEPNVLHVDPLRPTQVYFAFLFAGSQGTASLGWGVLRPLFSIAPTDRVILICVDRKHSGNRRIHYCLFDRWLRSAAGQLQLATKADVLVDLSRDFHPVGDDESVIASAMSASARQSHWAARGRDSPGLYAFDEETFYLAVERATRGELPAVRRPLRRRSAKDMERIYGLMRGDHPIQEMAPQLEDPELGSWILALGTQAEARGVLSAERYEFLAFVRVLERFQEGLGFRLPRFKAESVRAWRSFVDCFPGAVQMLEHVVTNFRGPEGDRDVPFAAALLPIVAHSPHGWASDTAFRTLRVLARRVDDYPSYRFRREALRACAEAGERPELAKGLELIGRAENRQHELDFLESYGWRADVRETYLRHKLLRPTVRDEQLKSWYERMQEVTL